MYILFCPDFLLGIARSPQFGARCAIQFELKNGVQYAPEKIDESTLLPQVDDASAQPLVLNFKAVKTINSYGTRKLLGFVRKWLPRTLEYHECPSIFIDTINIVRDLLGTPRDPSIVKSFAVPHYCNDCATYFDVMAKATAIVRDADDLGLPKQACPKCKSQDTEIDVEPDEHLAFYGE